MVFQLIIAPPRVFLAVISLISNVVLVAPIRRNISLLILSQLFLQQSAYALTVNIDYDYDQSVYHSGDNGVFSQSGGTYWNPVKSNKHLRDENGVWTDLYVSNWNVGGTGGGAGEELFRDTPFVDTTSGGNDYHDITGLSADTEYYLAVYTNPFAKSRVSITHAGGITTSDVFGGTLNSYGSLPGTLGIEYTLFYKLLPYEISNDVYGLTITTAALDSEYYNSIHGLQITTNPAVVPGAVPIPAAIWLFSSGLIGLVGLARRKADA